MCTLQEELAACRARQQRLLHVMQEQRIDLVVVSTIEHVQYLFGPRFAWTFTPFGILTADGRASLVGPENRIPDSHAADQVYSYEARWHSTLRNDQREAAARVLQQVVQPATGARCGVEFSCFTRHLAFDVEWIDIEPALLRLRRRKDALELGRLRRAIAATERMYAAARNMVVPGVNELDVYRELQSVAVATLREPLTGTGNDYRCGARGGAPRDRLIAAGELYILDLGPAYQGYFADNARTLAVSEPTDVQLDAWKQIVDVFAMIEAEIQPGVSARHVFQMTQRRLDRCTHGVFNHHLGHGIGLFPHEAPHLNPNWDDVFEVGDVFTAEPGVYGPELHAGIRLENDYLVTEKGIERLTPFALELKL